MLVIKLELWPHGDHRDRKELGRMIIGNMGRKKGLCTYKAIIREPGSLDRTIEPGDGETFIEGIDRLTISPWDLVRMFLTDFHKMRSTVQRIKQQAANDGC